jgi:hypothetical protein
VHQGKKKYTTGVWGPPLQVTVGKGACHGAGMVYRIEICYVYPDNLRVESDKPQNTWDTSKYLHLHIKDCTEGMQIVKKGVKQLLETDFQWFAFLADECGCALDCAEWELP